MITSLGGRSTSAEGGRHRTTTGERLVDLRRFISPLGRTYVDDETAVSADLASEVAEKAINLEVEVVLVDGTTDTYECQAGLIRVRHLTESPDDSKKRKRDGRNSRPRFAVTPTTAKHNIISGISDGGVFERYRSAKLHAPGGRSCPLTFPDGGFEPQGADAIRMCPPDDNGENEVLWPCGVDVTKGEVVEDPSHYITQKIMSFEKVRDDFVLTEGQKIAIAVYRKSAVSRRDACAPPGTDLERHFGQMNRVNVYTGAITSVSFSDNGTVLEHNINTFAGCSGAIVFLLDKNQGSLGVEERDYGKAIAVHVGGDPCMNCNFAFKI
jgi:hypothetical protein